jgi:hypothetical protein
MANKTQRTSFLFYLSWRTQINDMNDDELRRFINNLINWHEGEEIELPTREDRFIWNGVLPGLESNVDKYETQANANRENGKKGGRPRKPKETQDNPNNPMGFSETQKSRKEINVNSQMLNDNCEMENDNCEMLNVNGEGQLSNVNGEIEKIARQELLNKRTTVLYQILDDKSMINFKKMQNGFTQLLSYVEGNNHNMISQVTKHKELPQHIAALIEQYHEYKV